MVVSTFDYMDFISKVGVGGITGVIASFITAKLTIRRFYSEKWWEKKQIAYNQLVDMLIEMKSIYIRASFHYDKVRTAEQRLESVDYYFDWSRFYVLDSQIKRAYILAPISLSSKTKTLLTTYFKVNSETGEAINEEGYPEEAAYNELAGKVQALIDAIVQDAKVELKFK